MIGYLQLCRTRQPAPSRMRRASSMCARCDGFSDLGEMRAHGLCVGMWHDQSGRFSPFRADGARCRSRYRRVPSRPSWPRGRWACSTPSAQIRVASARMLANPRFILKPYLQGLAAGLFRQGCFYIPRRSFFKSGLCIRVGFRMLQQTPPGSCQLFATVRSCMVDAEALFDLAVPQCAASMRPTAF